MVRSVRWEFVPGPGDRSGAAAELADRAMRQFMPQIVRESDAAVRRGYLLFEVEWGRREGMTVPVSLSSFGPRHPVQLLMDDGERIIGYSLGEHRRLLKYGLLVVFRPTDEWLAGTPGPVRGDLASDVARDLVEGIRRGMHELVGPLISTNYGPGPSVTLVEAHAESQLAHTRRDDDIAPGQIPPRLTLPAAAPRENVPTDISSDTTAAPLTAKAPPHCEQLAYSQFIEAVNRNPALGNGLARDVYRAAKRAGEVEREQHFPAEETWKKYVRNAKRKAQAADGTDRSG